MDLNINVILFLFVLMRMSGCIMFNPIFGRRTLPVMFRIGLTVLLAWITYNMIPHVDIVVTSPIIFCVIALKELAIGLIVGFIIQLFLSAIVLGGEIIDMQMGISMSKIFDPQSNVSMSISATMLNIMLMLIFFTTNGHLTMIQIFCKLGTISPYGQIAVSADLFREVAGLFSYILIYAIKITLPMLAIQIIAEMGVGLLMKAVPQINVFVVNLQMKILIGFIMTLLLVPSYARFLERLITLMFDKINYLFAL